MVFEIILIFRDWHVTFSKPFRSRTRFTSCDTRTLSGYTIRPATCVKLIRDITCSDIQSVCGYSSSFISSHPPKGSLTPRVSVDLSVDVCLDAWKEYLDFLLIATFASNISMSPNIKIQKGSGLIQKASMLMLGVNTA